MGWSIIDWALLLTAITILSPCLCLKVSVKTSESPHWKRLLTLEKKRKLPSLTTTTKTSYLALSKVTQQLSPFTLWLLSAVKNTEQSEHQYSLLWLQKFPWKPFFSPILFKLPQSSKSPTRTKPALETTFTLHVWHSCFQPTWESQPWHTSWQVPGVLSSSREGKWATPFTTGLQVLGMDIIPTLLLTFISPEDTACLL